MPNVPPRRPDLASLIRLPVPRDEAFDPLRPSWLGSTTAAARPAKGRQRDEDDEDEDDEDDDEDEDDDDEDERPRKKAKAKVEAPKKKAKDDKAPKKPKKEEEEEEEDEPFERRVPKKGTRRYQLYVVNNGLATLQGCLIALVVVAFLSSLDTTLFQVLQIGVSGPVSNRQRDSLGDISGMVILVLQAVVPLAFLVAEGMLFFTPSRADAKGSLIAAFVLHAAPLLLLIAWLMIPSMFERDKEVAGRLQYFLLIAAHATYWLGFLMLVSYLKQFYYYLGDQPTGNTTSTLGLFYVIVIVLGYGFFFMMRFLGTWLDWLYFVLTPLWFLWDGAIGRVHFLLLRYVKRLRRRIDHVIYPDAYDDDFDPDQD